MRVIHHHALDELQRLQDAADRPAMVLKLRALRLARNGWARGPSGAGERWADAQRAAGGRGEAAEDVVR